MPEAGAHDPALEALLEDVFRTPSIDPELLLRYHRDPEKLSAEERAKVEHGLEDSAHVRAQLELLGRFGRSSRSPADRTSALESPRPAPRRPRSRLRLLVPAGIAAAAALGIWLATDSSLPEDPLAQPTRAVAPEPSGLDTRGSQGIRVPLDAPIGLPLLPRDGGQTALAQPNLYFLLVPPAAEETRDWNVEFELTDAQDRPLTRQTIELDPGRRLQKISLAALDVSLEPGTRYRFSLSISPRDADAPNPAARSYSIERLPEASPEAKTSSPALPSAAEPSAAGPKGSIGGGSNGEGPSGAGSSEAGSSGTEQGPSGVEPWLDAVDRSIAEDPSLEQLDRLLESIGFDYSVATQP